ncbi:MAG: CrcB family protein [Phycisphaerales bacterium]|nr:CrcB family protein [Phycisphaerales bacterium]
MMRLLPILACISIGGGFGALAREGTMSLMHGIIGLPVFVSLGIVNVLGSFLIGIVFGVLEGHLRRDGKSRLKQVPHSKPLEDKVNWWPDGDPTMPAVDVLRAELSLQMASALLITGFLGAYTTFSAFCLLTVQLLQADQIMDAVISVVGSISLGLLVVWIGLHLGVRLVPKTKSESLAS